MREILFRGKTKNGEWKIGDLIIEWYGETPYIHWFEYSSLALSREEKVIPETVGQFTGLTDKNGKKIFEGDIIQGTITSRWDKSLIRCEIVYKGDCFLAIEKISNTLWEHKIRFAKDIEVIGNIHDNPELLEKYNA